MSVVLYVTFTPGPVQRAQTRDDKLKLAPKYADLPGLQWKLWISDDAAGTRGGIYLFDDPATARAWGDGAPQRLAALGATDVTVRYFEVNEEQSALTHAQFRGQR